AAVVAPHDVPAIGAVLVGALVHVPAIEAVLIRAPDDVAAIEAVLVRAPDNAAAIGGAPDDVLAVDAAVGAPLDAEAPRVRVREHESLRQELVAPDNVAAPDRLDGHDVAGVVLLGVELGQTHRAERVQESGALLEPPVRRQRLRAR